MDMRSVKYITCTTTATTCTNYIRHGDDYTHSDNGVIERYTIKAELAVVGRHLAMS